MAKSYAGFCGKVAESVVQASAGCSSLAQTKYLYRHNAALKILFFELLREHGLIEEVPPWYSPVMPKPAYQNTTSEAFWDILIYAEHNEVRATQKTQKGTQPWAHDVEAEAEIQWLQG